MDGVSNCLLKPTVDSFSVDIKSDWAHSGEGNNWTVTAVKITVGACIAICFNVELGEGEEVWRKVSFGLGGLGRIQK
jgi:hypothetical protein